MNNSKGFLNVIANRQTYRNILYLLLSFPLGIVYFVFLVTGLSLGVSLLIIWLGVPILLIVFIISHRMVEFERQLANEFLRVDIPPLLCKNVKGQKILGQLKRRLHDPVMWKEVLYLFTKFPLGIISFIVSITLITLTLCLITAPLTYQFVPISIGFYRLNTLNGALAASILGFGVGLISLSVMNSFACLMGRYASRMFRSPQQNGIYSKLTEM